ncbi:MAG: acyltransferase domain-containing protein [Acutalibacteraceae bacterium]|nr:acyltransferase domain-containing protein [Acutalibacteraceae bacterium]
MRSYLEKFFQKYEYTKEDSDYLLSCYDKIQSSDFAKECFDKALALYEENINCEYNDVIDLVDKAAKEIYIYEYTAELLIFIMFTRKLKERYNEKGISDEIFDTTVKDFRYQMEILKNIKCIIGTECAPWCIGFVRMERFGIGRLQYEIINFGLDYEKDGKVLTPDTKVLNVHIPASGQPLSTELVMESFKMAKEFYKGIIGEPFAFKCSSWLLYPEHEQMLEKTSNIYRFMKIFDYLGYGIKKNNGDLYRIFGTYESRPEYLPEKTSLQRAYKKHLLAGGKTGYGIGVYIL